MKIIWMFEDLISLMFVIHKWSGKEKNIGNVWKEYRSLGKIEHFSHLFVHDTFWKIHKIHSS